MFRTTTPLVTCSVALLSITAFASPVVAEGPQPVPGASTEKPADEHRLGRETAARNIARIAFSDLALQEAPVADDHRITMELLAIAYDLWPSEQLNRWRLGAASAAQEREEGVALCKLILREDPANTVVQYHLITLLLDQAPNADDKLARLRRLIGPEGASLDPSIRSRLCMDAASLCQQLGDEPGFVELVKQATKLDASNRDAAAAAAAYFAERVDDPIGRLELLANLLLAEPADPETQMAIGRELSSLGAFTEARRFQENVSRMIETAQVPVPPQLARERLYSQWGSEGPQVVVNDINAQIASYRAMARRQIEEMEKDPLATGEAPRPEDVRLEVVMERLRLIAAVSARDDRTRRESIKDLRATIATRAAELADPRKRPAEIDDAMATELTRQMLIGSVTLMCWANEYAPPATAAKGTAAPAPTSPTPAAPAPTQPAPVQPEPVQPEPGTDAAPDQPAESAASEPAPQKLDVSALLAELDSIKTTWNIPDSDLDFQTAYAWVLVRAGRLDEALPILESIGDQRVEAQLALAQLHLDRNDKDSAEQVYRLLWRSVPQSLEAMFAYSSLRDILGREDIDPQLVKRARGFAEGIPAWIDKIGAGGHSFMSLEADVTPTSATALEPTTIRLRLRNLTPVPLGVGSDRTLNSQILVGSSMEIGLSNIRAYLTPEATSLARRLRLMPNETITIDYWPDAGSAGWVIDECCDRLIRQRWRVVQGFMRSDEGVITTGALCLSRETRSQVRIAVPQAALTNVQLTEKLSTSDMNELAGVASVIRARMLNPIIDRAGVAHTLTAEERAAFAAAAAASYPSLPVEGRLLLLSILPQASIIPEMKPLDDAARLETEPTAAALVLVTRVTDAKDPFLASALTSTHPRVARLASIISDRLTGGGEGFAARGGPDVLGIIQDSMAEQSLNRTGVGGP
jgi:tetratricopeptide (TPR) repeat protein